MVLFSFSIGRRRPTSSPSLCVSPWKFGRDHTRRRPSPPPAACCLLLLLPLYVSPNEPSNAPHHILPPPSVLISLLSLSVHTYSRAPLPQIHRPPIRITPQHTRTHSATTHKIAFLPAYYV